MNGRSHRHALHGYARGDATAALVADLHFVLTVGQLTDFKTTLERQSPAVEG